MFYFPKSKLIKEFQSDLYIRDQETVLDLIHHLNCLYIWHFSG